MTKQNEVYKCEICGNITEVLHSAGGELVCCGQAMKLMTAQTEDAGQEKHLPVIKRLDDDTVLIKVGDISHPMTAEHYIEWIEIKTASGKIKKKYLQPDDQAEFKCVVREKIVWVRAYCNLHGLWIKNN